MLCIRKLLVKFLISNNLNEITLYLEDSKQCDRKCIEVRWRRASLEIELSTKQLHSKQSKDKNEQE